MPDEEGTYRWLWYATFSCACIALALCLAYYLRHSDRNIFDTFQKPPGPSVNGTGGETPAEVLDPSEAE